MVCGGGVESICTQLTELGVPIAPSTYYDQVNREPSRRQLRDEALKPEIARVHATRPPRRHPARHQPDDTKTSW
jgi:putative transposase